MNRFISKSGSFLAVTAVCVFFSSVAAAQTGGGYDLSHNVVSGGGEQSSDGNYSVEGTIGQPVAGDTSTDTIISLVAGFWTGAVRASQSITFDPLSDQIYGVAPFPIVAEASSGLFVSFSAAGDCFVEGTVVSLTGAGTCTITASQEGNEIYAAAPDVVRSFDIEKAVMTIIPDDKTITYGEPDPFFNFSYFNFIDPDDETDIDTVPVCGVIGPHSDAGTYTIECSGGADDDYSFIYIDGTLTVNKAGLTVTADEKSSQYSDPLAALTYSFKGFVSGDTAAVVSGLPDISTTASSTSAPDEYPITISVGTLSAANYSFSFVDGTYRIEQEDARAFYTGSLFVNTSCIDCDDATITLAATVKDITAVTGDPDHDSYPGDIRNSTVTFIVRNEDGTQELAALPAPAVNLVSPTDTKVGTALVEWEYDLPSNSDSDTLTVEVVIGGYYSGENDTSDNAEAMITVSRPLAERFITGGGYLLAENSIGQFASTPGSKANFGFNVKYNRSGKRLQGSLNLIIRSGGRRYQIKGNAMQTLATNPVGEDPRTASYEGKANLRDVTDPGNPVSLAGNLTVRVEMTDRGEPGNGGAGFAPTDADTIGFTVWDGQGALVYSSSWDGTRSVEQALAGGNLVIR